MRSKHHRSLPRISTSLLFTLCTIQSATVLAAPSWEGFYLGGYVGGAVAENKVSTDVGGVNDISYFSTTDNSESVEHAGSYTKNPGSAIVGIEAGHDWLYNNMVYGIVLDYGALPLSSSEKENRAYPDGSGNYTIKTSMKTDWSFTLRGRVGYPSQVKRWPSLLYVTGGLAMANVEMKNRFSDTTGTAGAGESSFTENKIGWTAGVGMEILSADNLSVDLEYLYIQLPSAKTTGTISNTGGGFGIPVGSLNSIFATEGKLRANLFKLGLNYRF